MTQLPGSPNITRCGRPARVAATAYSLPLSPHHLREVAALLRSAEDLLAASVPTLRARLEHGLLTRREVAPVVEAMTARVLEGPAPRDAGGWTEAGYSPVLDRGAAVRALRVLPADLDALGIPHTQDAEGRTVEDWPR